MPSPAEGIQEALLESKRRDGTVSNAVEEEFNRAPLVAHIESLYEESKTYRAPFERQWLKNVNSYKGKDTIEGDERGSEKSKVFVRTTTTKVKAAYSQIIESLFSDTKFPIGISATDEPMGVPEYAHIKSDEEEPNPVDNMEMDIADTEQEEIGNPVGIGYEGDGLELEPGMTFDQLKELVEKRKAAGYKLSEEVSSKLAEGIDSKGESPLIFPAKEAARKMEKRIHDQLQSTKAAQALRSTIFEACLLGTGVYKGAFNKTEEITHWTTDEDGNRIHESIEVKRPHSSFVSLWNFFPDPNAKSKEEAEFVIERHKMNRTQLQELKTMPNFKSEVIDELIASSGNYEMLGYEHSLEESSVMTGNSRLFEVLEYWGYADAEDVRDMGLEVEGEGVVQINAWVSGGKCLRSVVNPFKPARLPYFVVPYEVDPYSMFGTGVPESMEDSQKAMNGFARLAIDNLALAGNLVFDVDESMLIPGQSMEVYPGKVFKRYSGGAGQAIHGLSFPNTAPANLQMFQQFRQIADESTGIPSLAHGQTGVSGFGRTASGMSMILNNASLNIKTVIRNIDDFLLKPLGQAYYHWNLQFNDEASPEIEGDLEVKALGSSSLMMKEVRSQRLNQFLQMAANPALAPMINLQRVIKELAVSMDMSPEEVLNTPEEAMLYAKIMQTQAMQQPNAQQPQAAGSEQMGVPMPQEEGFTGNQEGMGNPEGINGVPPQGGL
jgi:hypothetical protein